MSYYDEELLAAKKALEREKHKTLETGIYVDDQLIQFSETSLEGLKIKVVLPDNFVVMPEELKNIKYPSKNAPSVLFMNLDTTVNFGFNSLPVSLHEGEILEVSQKFQTAIKNINPATIFDKTGDSVTDAGNEMSWFDFKGYSLDGQSYNRMVLVRFNGFTIQGIFNCPDRDWIKWEPIVDKVFRTIEERLYK